MDRDYSGLDRLLMRVHRIVSAAGAPPVSAAAGRPNPAGDAEEHALSESERRHAAGLMRVNHAGEVAAQALYLGQAMVARDDAVRDHLLEAAAEERDHLAWCESRLKDLGEGPSRLDPVWYAGSFAMGAIAGLAGDRWSLGFVEETEKQVSEHLTGHLEKLPAADAKSRAIVEKMREDEERHGKNAADAGAAKLPKPVQEIMRGIARVMTRSAYWI